MDAPQAAQTLPSQPRLGFNFGSLFSGTFTLYREQYKRLLSLQVVFLIPLIVVSLLTFGSAFGGGVFMLATSTLNAEALSSGLLGAGIALAIVGIVLGFLISLWQQVGLLVALRDKTKNIGTVVRSAWAFTPRLIGASILADLAIIAGTILLIIPGIYLSIALSMVSVAVVYEGLGGSNALKRSRALVSGNWWNVAIAGIGFSIIVGIPVGILNLIAGKNEWGSMIISLLTNFLLTPLAICFTFTLYHALKRSKGESA